VVFAVVTWGAVVVFWNAWSAGWWGGASDGVWTRHGNAQIALLVVADQEALDEYQEALTRLRCYAKRHGYEAVFVTSRAHWQCNVCIKFYCRKLCTLGQFMRARPHLEWVLVLDTDVAVVNFEKSLENAVLASPSVTSATNIILQARHTDEWCACSFMLRQGEWARRFVAEWIDYLDVFTPMRHGLINLRDAGEASWFGNEDNGALHIHLLRTLIPEQREVIERCQDLRIHATTMTSYKKYVACARDAIGRDKLAVGAATFFPECTGWMSEAYTLKRSDSSFCVAFCEDRGTVMVHSVKTKFQSDMFWQYPPLSNCTAGPADRLRDSVWRVPLVDWENAKRTSVSWNDNEFTAWRRQHIVK